MKFTLSWLKDHLDTEANLERTVDTLTAIGLEVDSVEDRMSALAPFTVARVLAAEPHPKADRLKVCAVDTGRERVQVVCGAPNARAGMKGVFAAVGSYIPGTDMTLTAARIRGVESNGMLVSEREMGLSDEHEGIIEMPDDAEVGEPFARMLGLDDPVIDVEVTPNRPDCTGIRGIARDLAAAGLGTLKPVETMTPVDGGFESPIRWEIEPSEHNSCVYVVGRYFRNVTNRPSPRWLQDRLRAIGLRPISALVDITNYVTFDLGRPLHVFDAAKLAGGALTMRAARDGEELEALNGKTYVLDREMTVIADERGVHGLGGVMGGEASGCTENTTEVFLEVALFDTVRTAATGRKLNLQSDARYRFERGVDPESADWGAEVAAHLIGEFTGGEPSHVVSAGAMPDSRRGIALRMSRARTLGGVVLAPERQTGILEKLGFGLDGAGETIQVTPPSWRPDVLGEADLIEEIVRINGLDAIPAVPLERETALPRPAITPRQRLAAQVRRKLAARGLYEAVSWSFTACEAAELFGGVPDKLRLANPISQDLDVMRPSILPNLIAAAGRNLDRGFADFGMFEIGPQYRDDTPDGQRLVAAGIRQGRLHAPHWATGARPVDAFDAKADALQGLAAAGAPDNLQVTRDAPGWYHPGRSATLRLGKTVLAHFGELHPRVSSRLDVRGPLVGFELYLDAVPIPKARRTTRPPLRLSPLQPVSRDFAFVVDEGVSAEDILRAVRGADKSLISEVSLFDVYTGEGIDRGKKSLAVTVTLQPVEATLTDEQIEAIALKIIQNVEKRAGGVLRG
ncbi:MAG: phenylalanine--tRNA ligase subunit beta [Alphaproteobacteria bacterium]